MAPQALLTERITDCHVQKFFCTRSRDSIFSRINYDQAALTISEVQTEVKAEIKKQCSENTRNHKEAEEKEGIQAEVNNLNDLRNEATLSLARILRKKGSISAMFDNHEDALV